MGRVRIGTRGSALALAQAFQVASLLRERGIDSDPEEVVIRTSGDRIQDRSLAEIGGKGLFIKEIEEALLEGAIDLAVHSMKDLPGRLAPGLSIAAVLPRERPRDALITRGESAAVSELPQGAVVGTSSLRRRSQCLSIRPDLQVIPLRGNVDTRLRKLAEGVDGLDAILLAEAGLRRLGRTDVDAHPIPVDVMLPAVAQGAIALEARDGSAIHEALAALNHPETSTCVDAERAILTRLSGSCRIPLAGYATVQDDGQIWLRALLSDPDGRQMIRGERMGSPQDGVAMGTELAEALLADGGDAILTALGIDPEGVGDG